MTRYCPKLDSTWRLVQRGQPQGIDPSVDGKDCYVFQRAGGERPTDKFSTRVIPVERFWSAPALREVPDVVTNKRGEQQ